MHVRFGRGASFKINFHHQRHKAQNGTKVRPDKYTRIFVYRMKPLVPVRSLGQKKRAMKEAPLHRRAFFALTIGALPTNPREIASQNQIPANVPNLKRNIQARRSPVRPRTSALVRLIIFVSGLFSVKTLLVNDPTLLVRSVIRIARVKLGAT